MVSAVLSVGLGCSDNDTGSSGPGAAWTVSLDRSELTVTDDPRHLLTVSIDGTTGGSVTVLIADSAREIVMDPQSCTLSADDTSCAVSASAPLYTATGVHNLAVWTDPSSTSPTLTWVGDVEVLDFGLTEDLATISIKNDTPCLPNPFITQRLKFPANDTCELLRTSCSNENWTNISCSNGKTYCNVGESTNIVQGLTCSYNWPDDIIGIDYGYKLPNFVCRVSGDTQEFQYLAAIAPPNPAFPAWAAPGYGPPQLFCQPNSIPCESGSLDGVTLNCAVAPELGADPVLSVDILLAKPYITNAGGLAGWENADLANLTSDSPSCPSDTTPFASDLDYSCVCVDNETTNPPITGTRMPTISFQLPWIQAVGPGQPQTSQVCLGQ